MKENIKVVYIKDEYELSLNVGEDDGVKKGQIFLIYSLSNHEIIDPDTKESLGYLELVKGTGSVIHVQPKLCTIRSNEFETQTSKRITSKNPFVPALGSTTTEEVTPSKIRIPFDEPDIDDLARPI